MTERTRLERDIATLRESVRIDGHDIGNATSAAERKGILQHIGWCIQELQDLKARLEKTPADRDASNG